MAGLLEVRRSMPIQENVPSAFEVRLHKDSHRRHLKDERPSPTVSAMRSAWPSIAQGPRRQARQVASIAARYGKAGTGTATPTAMDCVARSRRVQKKPLFPEYDRDHNRPQLRHWNTMLANASLRTMRSACPSIFEGPRRQALQCASIGASLSNVWIIAGTPPLGC
ncbi:MAG TPA: hypothetical protein VN782_15180 [Usitatibacter sp.]|nr:hypothetical protein [Usitatibacter sp.]